MTKTKDEEIAELRQAMAALIAENERLKGGAKMKPEITKEQAEAIEEGIKVYIRQGLRPGSETYNHFLIDHTKVFTAVTDPWKDLFSCLNDMDIATLAAALINGYEIVKSPEEKVREYYKANYAKHEKSKPYSDDDYYTTGVSAGISRTLDLLGIKIEGVNVDREEADVDDAPF